MACGVAADVDGPKVIAKGRASVYRPVLKVGEPVRSATTVFCLLAMLSFLATPFGMWMIMWVLQLCSGVADVAYVQQNPLACMAVSGLITSAFSVSSFLVFGRYWDGLYCTESVLRCQTKKHDVSGLFSRSEVRLSCLNLVIAAFLSAAMVVVRLAAPRYGPLIYTDLPATVPAFAYLLASTVAYFLCIDVWAYVGHRLLHLPFLYKSVHKWHHAYTQPTAFSALGLHPVDMLMMQGGVYLLLFVLPMHPAGIAVVLLYLHYYNVVDHSGVYCESRLPWQASSLYHDDHHQFFHLNYGQSITLWDVLGGTIYNRGKKYGERTFSY